MSKPAFPKAIINAEGIKELLPNDFSPGTPSVEVIDVRRPDEYTGELGHIKGSKMVTLEKDFKNFIEKAPKDKSYVFVCKSGGRSGQAAGYAQSLGISDCY